MSQEQIQIPKGWELKKLSEIGDIITGSTPKTANSEYYGSDYPFYGPADLGSAVEISQANKGLSKKGLQVARKIPEDSILVQCIGDLGKSSIIKKTGACNQQINVIIPNKQLVIPKFLFFWINSNYFNYLMKQAATKTTLPILNKSKFSNLPFFLPPLPIQKKIVQKLDDILGQLEEKKKEILKLVDKNSENLETLAEQFQGELITKFFNSPQVLDNSEIKRLDEVCTINPSKQEIKDLDDKTQVSFIPMKLVDDKKGEITTTEIRNLGDVKGGYTYFKENDVIFAKITPCMQNGKCAIGLDLENGIAFGSTEFHVFRVKEDVLPEWIYYFLRQYKLRKHAEKNMTGTAGQKRVPKEFLASYKIPIPPKSIQKDMIKKIKESSSHIHSDVKILNSIRDSHQNLLQQLDNSQSSILDAAFSGKLLK